MTYKFPFRKSPKPWGLCKQSLLCHTFINFKKTKDVFIFSTNMLVEIRVCKKIQYYSNYNLKAWYFYDNKFVVLHFISFSSNGC